MGIAEVVHFFFSFDDASVNVFVAKKVNAVSPPCSGILIVKIRSQSVSVSIRERLFDCKGAMQRLLIQVLCLSILRYSFEHFIICETSVTFMPTVARAGPSKPMNGT